MARNVPRYKEQRHSYVRDMHVQWRSWGNINGAYTQEPHPLTVRATDTVVYGPNYPDWQLRLALGAAATTYLSGLKFSSKCSELHMTVVGTKYAPGFGRRAQGFNQDTGFPSPPHSGIDSIAERNAASSLLADYLKVKRTWHGGAAIAEFSETVQMLAHPVDSIYKRTYTFVKSVGRLRKMYRRDPIGYGKLLGQLWLAYAFGIAPLVSDVKDAQSAVNVLSTELGMNDQKRLIGSGYNRIVSKLEPMRPVPWTSYAYYDRTLFIEYGVRYIAAVNARPPGIGDIAGNFGVGFDDILPSVWEGVPWSWLVDYFVNVNEMLESIAWVNADIAWCQRTVRNRSWYQLSAVRPYTAEPAYFSAVAGGGQGYYQTAVVNRVSTNVPYPSWRFRVPGLPNQFANVAALVLAIKGSKPT